MGAGSIMTVFAMALQSLTASAADTRVGIAIIARTRDTVAAVCRNPT